MRFIVKNLIINIAVIVIIVIGISVANPNTTPEEDKLLSELLGQLIVFSSVAVWSIATFKAKFSKK